MFVEIHQANLAAKESAAFGSLKKCLYPSPVSDRTVHQSCTVRTLQKLLDKIVMVLCLFQSEYPAEDTALHRQNAVLHTCFSVARVKQQTYASVFLKQAVTRY